MFDFNRFFARSFRLLSPSKRAAGDAISAIILFVAVLSVSIGVVVAFQQFILDTQTSLDKRQDYAINSLNTQLIVSNVYYDSGASETHVYVKNVGTTTLAVKNLAFFINEEYGINLSPSLADDVGNPVRELRPQKTLYVVFPKVLTSGTHTLLIVSEYGSGVSEEFNVS